MWGNKRIWWLGALGGALLLSTTGQAEAAPANNWATFTTYSGIPSRLRDKLDDALREELDNHGIAQLSQAELDETLDLLGTKKATSSNLADLALGIGAQRALLVSTRKSGRNYNIQAYLYDAGANETLMREVDVKKIALLRATRESVVELLGEVRPLMGPTTSSPKMLGVKIRAVSSGDAQRLGRGTTEGAIVVVVKPNGIGENTGLRSGDLLLKVGRQPLKGPSELSPSLAAIHGPKAPLVVWRSGKTKTLIADFSGTKLVSRPKVKRPSEPAPRRGLGVKVRALTDNTADDLGLMARTGALIVEVTDDGAAVEAGLRVDDIILSIDHQRVGHARELSNVVASTTASSVVRMRVWRKNKEISLPVFLGQKTAMRN